MNKLSLDTNSCFLCWTWCRIIMWFCEFKPTYVCWTQKKILWRMSATKRLMGLKII